MSCQTCGRDGGHYIGCTEAETETYVHTPEQLAEFAAQLCAKDGCSRLRAVSKGPRPAKYCEQHKTGSRK